MVSLIVHLRQFLRRRRIIATEPDLRVQGDSDHGQPSRLVFPEDANCLIPVTVHREPLLAGGRKERQHVATGKAGDERLLGIDAPLVSNYPKTLSSPGFYGGYTPFSDSYLPW